MTYADSKNWGACLQDNKQLLLDEVLVISIIIKVEVGVISLSNNPYLDITKTEPNNYFIIH